MTHLDNTGPEATLVVVTARLSDPAHESRFMDASEKFLHWLRSQPGFLRYELFRSADGQFSDTMLWESPEHSADANERFEATAIRAEFADIVENYQVFSGTRVPLGKIDGR